MMDVTLEVAVAQITHTDANTRMALSEQDERLKDAIAETKAELSTQISAVEQAVRLHDGAFGVMEGLLEQNNEAILAMTRWLRLAIYGVAGLSAIVMVLVILLLGRAVLVPTDLLWMAGAILAFSAGLTLVWLWRRRGR
jgi:hypothetical protein